MISLIFGACGGNVIDGGTVLHVSGCASMTHLWSLGHDFTVTSVTCDIMLEGEIGLIG